MNSENEDDDEVNFFIESYPEGRKYSHGIEIMMDDFDPEYPRYQKLADAKLIIAASDMKKALEDILKSCNIGDATPNKLGNPFYVGSCGIPSEESIHKAINAIKKSIS